MATNGMLKWIHLVAMAWFVACAAWLIAMALRQVGFQWWLVFSLSGHSALVLILLASLYLFAFFRSAGGARRLEVEHPLTTSHYYLSFYVSAPLLGGLVGVLGMAGIRETDKFLFGVALGTLGTTFLVWIVIDPLIGIVETLSPASRRRRAERIGRAGE